MRLGPYLLILAATTNKGGEHAQPTMMITITYYYGEKISILSDDVVGSSWIRMDENVIFSHGAV
ncbi:unnamed protein product [Coffea canephora]|uniref:Uncharacterized protein n=1 Tax=Coffea canephora TaxID=49390 RepID=A0A068UXJ6_COFCA|nr:unnamed protein product [Coffea canephora]